MTGFKAKNNKVEILAPAGSFESFMAAIAAGADAVYAGGPVFGARAFATNFTEEKLLEAIDIAHIYGRKFYLTVNTLVKDGEIPRLIEYLTPLYKHGLDAVIVQDTGVMNLIRSRFPKMGIHASTQTTITNKEGALFLKNQGAERVVPARELSLKEVRDIYDETGMEVECFVHGALCYCYSGQCLMSSLIGGRSGNRGQCAQPCRLMYNVGGEKKYFMSLKDICTLDIIPDLIEAGIYSFKIEGRMKKPEYVASVTSMYRKYADMYLKNGRAGYKVLESDREKLMDIYNRGNFSEGYYKTRNSRDMLCLDRPNHTGVKALKVVSQKGSKVTVKALTSINKGDVIELPVKGDSRLGNYTIGEDYKPGSNIVLNMAKGVILKKDTVLNRIRNEKLISYIDETYVDADIKTYADAYMTLEPYKPIELTLVKDDISVTVYSDELVQEALNKPLDKERILRQLNKTGNTRFKFDTAKVYVSGNVFVPMAQVNDLRRRAIEELEKAVTSSYRREIDEDFTGEYILNNENSYRESSFPAVYVVTESFAQLRAAAANECVSRIYINSTMERDFFETDEILNCVNEILSSGREVYLGMPYIFREDAIKYFKKNLDKLKIFTGFLVRNFESYKFLKDNGFSKIVLDKNMYVFNNEAKDFWNKEGVNDFTAPLELNHFELERLGINEAELIVYGRIPVMISAQCIKKTSKGCDRKPEIINMGDRTGEKYTVKNCCGFCYNVVYDTKPLYLMDMKEELEELSPCAYRIDLSNENFKESTDIIDLCVKSLYKDEVLEPDTDYTRGHFTRGVN